MKRIILMLTVAAFMVATLTVTAAIALADPNCQKVGANNQNCQTVVDLPGKAESSGGQAINKNPNKTVTTTFHGRPQ
jgi:hypothetical protein